MKTSSFSARRFVRVFKVLVLTGLLTTSSLSAQGWFNVDWQYRVPVTITNTGSELTNFQVQVILGPSFDWGSTQAGGADIRFTSDNGMNEIDFWIESWNSGTSASIWVEVPTVEGTPDITPIYMYYGNSGASSASDGFDTFDFFDDFEESGLTVPNPERWSSSGGTWSIFTATEHDGSTGKVARGQIPVNEKHLLYSSDFSGTDYVVEVWGRQTTGRVWGLGVRSTSNAQTYTLNLYEDLDGGNNLYYYAWITSSSTETVHSGPAFVSPNVVEANTWYKLKVSAHGSTFDLYVSDNLRATGTNTRYGSGGVGLFGEYDSSPQTAGDYQYNDIRVRKYAAPEPSATIGSVQVPTILIDYESSDVSCHGGSDGSITLTVSGGTPPYSFDWTGPGGFTSESQNISGLVAGTYLVTVSDNASHEGGQTVVITQPDPITLSYQVTVPYDCTSGTATIEILASGGTPSYTYNGGASAVFIQSLGTENYSVTDSEGCTANISITISADGSWLDPDWQYRKPVAISNSSGSALTDFQVQINLDDLFEFEKANDDGSDIRFTTEAGTEIIPYWIESWDETGEQAKIWVKVPALPVSGTNIYMYYGNSEAEAASSGVETFDFFDDFTTTVTQQEGYYEFGPAINNIIPITWESAIGEIGAGGVAHTLSVVKAPVGAAYDYYGYYGPQGSGYVAIAGSDDLVTWTKFPYNQDPGQGTVNPIAMGGGERWPSVYYNENEGTYYMVHTMSYGSSYIVYRQSSNGLDWSGPTTIVPHDVSNQNPSLFYDNGNYYLYWYRGGGVWNIMARQATTVAGLVNAPNQTLLVSSTTLAAPQVLYYDNTYFLSTEVYPGGIWQVRMYSGPTPTGPFTVLPGNPVLADGCACLFQHLFNGSIYEYYCKQTSGTWTLDMRVVDPSTGRIMYEQADFNASKWTTDGGDWTIQSATQPDGTTGHVAQGITSGNQILKSSFSGSDYILEGYGRQISGNVWGLGFRTSSAGSTYTLSLYDNHDAEDNLYFYRWPGGAEVWKSALGTINPNVWYKLKLEAHGSSFDVFFGDDFKTTATDNTYTSGSVALFGENGTIAQYDDIRVRKYTETEPSSNIGSEEFPGQWTGTLSNEWNNAGNWSSGIPGPCSFVTILPSANQPLITGISPFECLSLSIGTGAIVTIGAGAALTITGNLSNDGSLFIESTSTVESGSLIVGSATGSGLVTYNRFLRPEATRGDRHFFSSPVSGLAIDEFRTANTFGEPAVTKVNNLWIYDEFTGGWPEITNSTDDFILGKGYNVDQATGSDGLLRFAGTVVNSANITATSPYANYNGNPRLTAFDYGDGNTDPLLWTTNRSWTNNYGGGGWNLLGNPFTSAMDATEFITENTGKFDPWYVALYIYDGRVGEENYKYVAPGVPGWEEDPYYEEGGPAGDVIQVGQGFFVLALYDQVEFNFTPDMQVHSNSVPILKSASAEDPWPGIRLNINNGDENRHATVVYGTEMSAGPDPGYDVGLLSEASVLEIYTSLPDNDNGINFVRQALPVTGSDQIKVPVGIDFEAGGEVTFSAVTVPIGSNRFWLEDRQTGIFTDLTTKSYTVNLPANTYGTGRFFIVASTNTPTGIKQPQPEDTGVRIWTSNEKLIVKGEVGDKAYCEIFDINGNLILKRLLQDNGLNTVDLPENLRGVFLVRVTDGLKVSTRKVALL